ncbi:hypothetical protein ACHHYP_15208 [Achlya hypogyna]|uniref:Transmembrane protein n=1 Tax=Achlya hypogyna TaxID=1202772 RepID=A0A1V9YBD2_ACHHY|nr:hypothetical protein ACHHYP_15208 [Achlya hypogyna]
MVIYVAFAAEAVAGVLLTSTFSTFHVETFLNEYKLDLASYASGHVLYAVVNTLNDLVGAYCVDAWAPKHGRAWLMLCGGTLWAFTFLLPWFPWRSYPAVHFVVSLSAYDTLYSFCAIAGGSLLTEMNISDHQRINILRLKTVVGMTTAFLATQAGQFLFSSKDMFRVYCAALACAAAGLYALFYHLLQRVPAHKLYATLAAPPSELSTSLTASIKAIFLDFYHLKNFRYWLGMEMCLETQSNFNRHYLRVFLGHFAGGLWSPATLTTVISGLPLLKQLVKLGVYSVMDRVGVYRLYQSSFIAKFVAASLTFIVVQSVSTTPYMLLVTFLIFNAIATELPTGGFPIAMSNMHKELSLHRLHTGRGLVPSSSAMFMGLNAVFCKPMDSLLPILAATQLDAAGYQTDKSSPRVADTMVHLLLFPPLLLSGIQLWSWRRYTLNADKLATIEVALHRGTDEKNVV